MSEGINIGIGEPEQYKSMAEVIGITRGEFLADVFDEVFPSDQQEGQSMQITAEQFAQYITDYTRRLQDKGLFKED